ncbi:MAG: 2OG-Fe(II) oxygenase family protein [Allosphingosinicella sp.]
MKLESIDVLKGASARFPDNDPIASALATALAQAGDVDAALIEAARWKESAWSAPLALRLLAEHGRFAEAVRFEAAVAAADPADLNLLECRARRLQAEPESLLRVAEDVLALNPASSHALYFRAVALAQLGRDEEAAATMAVDRFVQFRELPAPPGQLSGDGFRDSVRSEILANSTLHPDPAAHTTRNGLRTLVFPLPGDSAAKVLLETIRDAIEDYSVGLAGDHPFIRSRPEQASFSAWAIVLRASGYQRLHHHPKPWMTGVYYVAAPRTEGDSGVLRIGVLPSWAGVAPPWPVLDVPPRPGTLVLFPSFVPHETVPTGSDAERISIAFDVDSA